MNIIITIQMDTQKGADTLYSIASEEGLETVTNDMPLERTLHFNVKTKEDRTSMRRLFTVMESLN
jgi:hypothetical protein